MEELEIKSIELSGDNLCGLPLFFRRIYFNSLASFVEEEKLFRYSKALQTDMMRTSEPTIVISKTFDKELIINKKSDEK